MALDDEKGLILATSAVQLHEGCKLKSYLDTGGVWTIGWGCTYYEDGTSVEKGQTITQDQADRMLKNQIKGYYLTAKKLNTKLTDNQLAALTSFCYNVGIDAFNKSTLAKKVKANPNDPTIAMEFMKWNKDNGKIVQGLTNRRKKEAEIYFL